MEQPKCYHNYPIWIVIISNLVSLSTYVIGGYIVYQMGLLWLMLYVFYVLSLELKLLKGHCVNCYYYGKTCAFGKGRLSSLFFKRGQSTGFNQIKITWKDIIPDFLVTVIPIIIGIITLILHFSWLILFLMVLLFILGFSGSAFVRGQLACKFCHQRKLGCPAQQLFAKRQIKHEI